VSLLSPDAALALHPGRALLRAGGRLLEQTSGAGWEGALSALDTLLAQVRPTGGLRASLSHHFAGVLLLEPPPLHLGHAEMSGWVRERLARDYGAEAQTLRPVWQDVPPGRPVPVAVMDAGRHEQLALRLRDAGLSLRQSAPWFVWAWNRHRRALPRHAGWLALIEPGRILLARAEGGCPAGLCAAPACAAPEDDLAGLLKRESLRRGTGEGDELWLASAGVDLVRQGTYAGRRAHWLDSGAGWGGLLP
jgi:hypothetical protein